MEIVFDEPFPYNNGNLLVGFYKTANGTNPSSNSWVGVNGVSGNSRYYTYSETSSSFLPKTTIAYLPNPDPVFYEITVEANPEVGGTVTGGGEMLEGRTLTLTATADHFYEFVNWTMDGVVVDTVNPLTLTVTEDATYVANFNACPPSR